MNDIEKAIENLIDINQTLKVQHMYKDMDGEATKEDIKIYKSRFASVNIAIEALTKQIPKTPKELKYKPLLEFGWKYECPSCGSAVGINSNSIDYTLEDGFCPTCGQKIDWDV